MDQKYQTEDKNAVKRITYFEEHQQSNQKDQLTIGRPFELEYLKHEIAFPGAVALEQQLEDDFVGPHKLEDEFVGHPRLEDYFVGPQKFEDNFVEFEVGLQNFEDELDKFEVGHQYYAEGFGKLGMLFEGFGPLNFEGMVC